MIWKGLQRAVAKIRHGYFFGDFSGLEKQDWEEAHPLFMLNSHSESCYGIRTKAVRYANNQRLPIMPLVKREGGILFSPI